MEISAYEREMGAELNDLRREREILAEEALSEKNAFASEVRDVLGEQIREVLKEQPNAQKVEKVKEPSKFKKIINSLISVIG